MTTAASRSHRLLLLGFITLALAHSTAWADEEKASLETGDEAGSMGILEITLIADLVATLEKSQSYPIDRYGHEFAEALDLDTVGRVGFGAMMRTNWKLPLVLSTEVEADVVSGGWLNLPTDSERANEGTSMPFPDDVESQMRKGYGVFSVGPFLHVGGGLNTSKWGLGLLANDGAQRWEPGSAAFVDPRGGDIVERYFVATGPFPKAPFSLAAFYDRDVDDDALSAGDKATQFGAAAKLGKEDGLGAGVYIVAREQEAIDGDKTDVAAMDLTARVPIDFDKEGTQTLVLEGEIAYVHGRTTLAPSFDYQTHEVKQLGAVARATFDAGGWGVVFDFLYASGDRNLDDHSQNGFKADRNMEMGLLLFKHVLRAQTGRASITAGDLKLVGVPAEDLDRFATQGSMTNTLSFFPRGYWAPIDGLEVYGGPLLALAEVDVVDPLNTRVEGGAPRNALGGAPSPLLGVELDLGVRFRQEFWLTALTAGLEGAVFFPGGGLSGPTGDELGPLFGGRFIVEYRL